MYLTELHAHTREVSPCASQTAAEVADRYIAAGYSTVIVANHYCDYVMKDAGETWDERYEHYLSGYRAMKEHAGGRLNVVLGMELRFEENYNDYLIVGFDEKFLYTHPDLHKMKLKEFSALARENGILVIQAHPFRSYMQVTPVKYLDGIEVFNGHAEHQSRNQLAREFCRLYGLIPTSGSDFHDATSETSGGILTDVPITSQKQLAEILSSRSYRLRCRGTAAERDGMQDFDASDLGTFTLS